MANASREELAKRILSDNISESELLKIKDILNKEKTKARGRPRSKSHEDYEDIEISKAIERLHKDIGKAKRAWVTRALWVRLEIHKNFYLAKSEKMKIINKSELCRRVTDKVLEEEITVVNRLKELDGFVIKVLFDSVIFGFESDFEVAQISNTLHGDPLAPFYWIDTGIVPPASVAPFRVFISRSIFMKFRKNDLFVNPIN